MAEPPAAVERPIAERRFAAGPRPVAALLPAITRPAFRRRSPAAAQLLADWPAIVGPALAAVTLPRRFSAGRLTLACTGPVAMELAHLAPQLLARINAHLGQALVAELRFTQDRAPESLPLPRAATQGPPGPAVENSVDNRLAHLPEGPLRAALAALGRSIHAAAPPQRKLPSTPAPRRG